MTGNRVGGFHCRASATARARDKEYKGADNVDISLYSRDEVLSLLCTSFVGLAISLLRPFSFARIFLFSLFSIGIPFIGPLGKMSIKLVLC